MKIGRQDNEIRLKHLSLVGVPDPGYIALGAKDADKLILKSNSGDEVELTMSPTGHYSDLRISNVVGSADTTLNITTTSATLSNPVGNSLEFRNIDRTANIALSGIGGLDTGVETVSTWYYVWLIGKTDRTVGALLSLSPTSPTVPTGYDYKRLISAVRNGSDGNLYKYHQVSTDISYDKKYNILVNGNQTVWTSIKDSLTPSVPPIAPILYVSAWTTADADHDSYYIYMSSDGENELYRLVAYYYTGGELRTNGFFRMPLITPQTFYYKCTNSTQFLNVEAIGFSVVL